MTFVLRFLMVRKVPDNGGYILGAEIPIKGYDTEEQTVLHAQPSPLLS